MVVRHSLVKFDSTVSDPRDAVHHAEAHPAEQGHHHAHFSMQPITHHEPVKHHHEPIEKHNNDPFVGRSSAFGIARCEPSMEDVKAVFPDSFSRSFTSEFFFLNSSTNSGWNTNEAERSMTEMDLTESSECTFTVVKTASVNQDPKLARRSSLSWNHGSSCDDNDFLFLDFEPEEQTCPKIQQAESIKPRPLHRRSSFSEVPETDKERRRGSCDAATLDSNFIKPNAGTAPVDEPVLKNRSGSPRRKLARSATTGEEVKKPLKKKAGSSIREAEDAATKSRSTSSDTTKHYGPVQSEKSSKSRSSALPKDRSTSPASCSQSNDSDKLEHDAAVPSKKSGTRSSSRPRRASSLIKDGAVLAVSPSLSNNSDKAGQDATASNKRSGSKSRRGSLSKDGCSHVPTSQSNHCDVSRQDVELAETKKINSKSRSSSAPRRKSSVSVSRQEVELAETDKINSKSRSSSAPRRKSSICVSPSRSSRSHPTEQDVTGTAKPNKKGSSAVRHSLHIAGTLEQQLLDFTEAPKKGHKGNNTDDSSVVSSSDISKNGSKKTHRLSRVSSTEQPRVRTLSRKDSQQSLGSTQSSPMKLRTQRPTSPAKKSSNPSNSSKALRRSESLPASTQSPSTLKLSSVHSENLTDEFSEHGTDSTPLSSHHKTKTLPRTGSCRSLVSSSKSSGKMRRCTTSICLSQLDQQPEQPIIKLDNKANNDSESLASERSQGHSKHGRSVARSGSSRSLIASKSSGKMRRCSTSVGLSELDQQSEHEPVSKVDTMAKIQTPRKISVKA